MANILGNILRIFGLRKTQQVINTKELGEFDYEKYLGKIYGRLWEFYGQMTKIEYERKARYRDYSQASSHPIISGVLNLYADDATQVSNLTGRSVWVVSVEKRYEDLLNRMFAEIGIEERIWDWAFTLAMYGDFFPHLIIREGYGVMGVEDDIHPGDVDRLEISGRLLGFRCPALSDGIMRPWEFVHFRHMTTWRRDWRTIEYAQAQKTYAKRLKVRPTAHYGSSVIEPARAVFKQLKLLEDTLVLARMAKSVIQRIYVVQGGNAPAKTVMAMVDAIKKELKQREAINLVEQMYKSEYNPISVNEDIIIPVLGEKAGIDVKEIGGDVDIRAIKDIDYMRKELFGALMVPPAFLGFTEEPPTGLGESSLVRLEIRYARSVKRLQRALRAGIKRICQIHLALNGQIADPELFDVEMESISTAEEEEKKSILDKSADVVIKIIDMLKNVGYEEVNKKYLLKYLIDSGLVPLHDIDLDELEKKVEELVFEVPSSEEEEGKEEKKESALNKIEKKLMILERQDFSAPLPGKEVDKFYKELSEILEKEIKNEEFISEIR